MSPEQQQSSVNADGEQRPNAPQVNPTNCWEPSLDGSFGRDVVAFKFGGSSLAGAERMMHSASLVREAAQSSPIVVVVSAMKGMTDRLLNIGQLLAQTRTLAARSEALAIVAQHLAVLRELQKGAQVLRALRFDGGLSQGEIDGAGQPFLIGVVGSAVVNGGAGGQDGADDRRHGDADGQKDGKAIRRIRFVHGLLPGVDDCAARVDD